MGKLSKPYIKCEKRDGNLLLTLMGGGASGHILQGRATVPEGDYAALQTAVIGLVDHAREGQRSLWEQVNGNS